MFRNPCFVIPDAIKFTVEHQAEPQMTAVVTEETVTAEVRMDEISCSLDNPDACEACGS